jgi:hypothetical protein
MFTIKMWHDNDQHCECKTWSLLGFPLFRFFAWQD